MPRILSSVSSIPAAFFYPSGHFLSRSTAEFATWTRRLSLGLSFDTLPQALSSWLRLTLFFFFVFCHLPFPLDCACFPFSVLALKSFIRPISHFPFFCVPRKKSSFGSSFSPPFLLELFPNHDPPNPGLLACSRFYINYP